MKKIFILITLALMTVGAFATPRLEGNKIYLDEAVASEATLKMVEENAANVEDEIYSWMLEVLTNPNKVIEFVDEEMANSFYDFLMQEVPNMQPEDFRCTDTGNIENLDLWLFLLFFHIDEYEIRDGKKVYLDFNIDRDPTYCYVSSF